MQRRQQLGERGAGRRRRRGLAERQVSRGAAGEPGGSQGEPGRDQRVAHDLRWVASGGVEKKGWRDEYIVKLAATAWFSRLVEKRGGGGASSGRLICITCDKQAEAFSGCRRLVSQLVATSRRRHRSGHLKFPTSTQARSICRTPPPAHLPPVALPALLVLLIHIFKLLTKLQKHG